MNSILDNELQNKIHVKWKIFFISNFQSVADSVPFIQYMWPLLVQTIAQTIARNTEKVWKAGTTTSDIILSALINQWYK